MTEPAYRRRPTAVLDVASQSERSLAETIRASGYPCLEVSNVDELVGVLRGGDALVGLAAFEALWPAPQRALRLLRDSAPGARLVVAFAANSPRLALGQRLWSVNLIDYWIPRSTPPHEMRPLLQQAHADALIERPIERPESAPGRGPTEIEDALSLLQQLTQSLNNSRRLDELLRVFHRKLYRIIDYQLLQVLVCSVEPTGLFVFPVGRIPHEYIWHLAESTCNAIAPYLENELSPDQLAVHNSVPIADEDEQESPGAAISIPLLLHGEPIGAVGLLPPRDRPLREHQSSLLKLVATHLASAIRNVELLRERRSSANLDELTGLPDRRFLVSALAREWRRAKRYNLPLSVVLIDIDHFADINRKEGHTVGDAVLRNAGRLIGEYLRETDHLIYFGDDRYLLILTNTGPAEATIVVERMRLAFRKRPVHDGGAHGPIQVTASAGVASFPVCNVHAGEDLVDLAVHAVRSAKEAGSDQVIVASGQAFESVFSNRPQDKRRYPRIPSDLAVKYIELPDLEGHLTSSRSMNVNSKGIAIEDPQKRLRKHSYALVYVEDAQTPLLSRVVWTRDTETGLRSAGLEFLRADDLTRRLQITQEIKAPPKALVITDNARTWVQVQRVLIAARYQIKVLKQGVPIPGSDELGGYALVVVGEQSLRGWLGRDIDTIRARLGSPARIVVINETESRAEALETIADHRIDHFVASNATSDAALFATLNKLLLGEYFGMQKYLLWGVTPKSWTVCRIEDKGPVLDGIRQVAQEVYCHPRITDLLIAAVDEMMINAMYHAGRSGEPAAPSQVTVECGTDGQLLAVSVVDEEGTLLADDLYRGLTQGLARKETGVPEDATSAGLGFRVMLDCLTQLAINVEAGRRTEVIGIVDLRKPFREYRRSVPTLGLFDKQTKAT